jgi:cellulose synthase/poly-beta-1,6-N-acetylglucosamine synthase-like glycosyltransferase
LLPPGILAYAELRAAEVGVGADRVLIAQGLLDEEIYLAELAHWLGIAFEPLDDKSRAACPLSDDHLLEAVNTGLLYLLIGNDEHLVVAPRGLGMRRLVTAFRPGSELAKRVRLTSDKHLTRFVGRHAKRTIGYRAAEAFRANHPKLSAGVGRRQSVATAFLAATFALFALLAPGAAAFLVEIALGTIFMAWTALRLLSTISLRPVRRTPQPVADDRLPIYTVAVALYREAAAARDLIGALRKLHYPLERLDIKLVLEPDDYETQEALAAMGLTAPFEVIIAPEVGPRTKPKALNAALPFARGSFIAVYDAEDRPEPDQLRLALEAFSASDARLACVQARLTIDNTSDSWLTRIFTAEYAGLFDVLLPGLAAWRLPLPLGGSSNHFRTEVLRKTGAWDPYNVTEDADLGMRLARLGYRTAVIQSTTYEEAPARFGPWLKQRTRWCKGWMQTWLVHMRSPRRLRRELGWVGFAAFQLLVGGTVLAALVHSLFVTKLLLEFVGAVVATEPTALASLGWHATVLLFGYVASIILGLVGLFRRRLLSCAWALALIPVYWVLLSLAAWRALIQLVRDPFRWEKTEHGLARTSRLAQGEPVARGAKDNGADRPRPRRACASC